ERVKTADAEEVVLHVVLARPGELDGDPSSLRDDRGFAHKIVDETAPESPACAHLVNGDFLLRETEHVRDCNQSRIGRLSRRPQLDAAVVEPSGAVLRLHRSMRYEGIAVEGLDNLTVSDRSIEITDALQRLVAFLLAELARFGDSFAPAILRCVRFVPVDLERTFRTQCGPRGACNDRHAGHDLVDLACSVDDEGVDDARHLLDLIEVRVSHLAADGGALLEYGIAHV